MAQLAEMESVAVAQKMLDSVRSNRRAAMAQSNSAVSRGENLRSAFRSGTLGEFLRSELDQYSKVTDGSSRTAGGSA
jgi:hypothetical protein